MDRFRLFFVLFLSILCTVGIVRGFSARSGIIFRMPCGTGLVSSPDRTGIQSANTSLDAHRPVKPETIPCRMGIKKPYKNLKPILKPGKSNRRTSLSPTANFLKKVGQKLLIRPFGPGFFVAAKIRIAARLL